MSNPQNAGDFGPDCSYGLELLIELEVGKTELFLTYAAVVGIQIFWQTSETECSSFHCISGKPCFSSLAFLLTESTSSVAIGLILPSGSPPVQLNTDF